MDIKTVSTLKKLNEEAVESRLDPDQWATILKTRVSEEEWALIIETISSGTLYLKQQTYTDMAVGRYPWMMNDTIIDEETGKTVTITPWMNKVKAYGVQRPNDIVHLDKIIRLVDNPAAKELFGY
jgi:hypothetical protein